MRVMLCTNSRDRGSTSRTLEGWVRRFPQFGVKPIVTVGGDGPLISALRSANVDVEAHPIRVFFEWRRPVAFLRRAVQLAASIRRYGVDLVHVNEHDHYPVAARAARLAGVPLVAHLRFKPDRQHCEWLFKRPYTPQRLFFTSQTQMDDSAEVVEGVVPRSRWRLIYNGLDYGVFGKDGNARPRLREQWGLPANTIAIGTASSISARKRLDHFVRLVAALAGSGLDVYGFIAGQPYFPDDERELCALKDLAVTLNVGDRVRFLGYVEPAEPLYHAWDICVSTSAYETFGMTVLEAMACGCPVIAYPGGSVTEVIGPAGTLVRDGDLSSLIDAARLLAADWSCRYQAGVKARERAKHFDLDRPVSQLIEEYRAVTGAASHEVRADNSSATLTRCASGSNVI